MILTLTTVIGYPFVIQFKRGGWRTYVCALPALIVWLIDVLANYTEIAWIFGWPKRGDYTITARVRRMQIDPDEAPARRELAQMVQVYLDACEPDGRH